MMPLFLSLSFEAHLDDMTLDRTDWPVCSL